MKPRIGQHAVLLRRIVMNNMLRAAAEHTAREQTDEYIKHSGNLEGKVQHLTQQGSRRNTFDQSTRHKTFTRKFFVPIPQCWF